MAPLLSRVSLSLLLCWLIKSHSCKLHAHLQWHWAKNNGHVVIAVRYLNTQYIKKQKVNEADVSYGGFSVELSEQMYEIGEVRICGIGFMGINYLMADSVVMSNSTFDFLNFWLE